MRARHGVSRWRTGANRASAQKARRQLPRGSPGSRFRRPGALADRSVLPGERLRLGRRDAVDQLGEPLAGRPALAGIEIGHRAVEAVASRRPAVLGDPPGGMNRQALAGVVARERGRGPARGRTPRPRPSRPTVACWSGTRASIVPWTGCMRSSHHHIRGCGADTGARRPGERVGELLEARERRRDALTRQQLRDLRPDRGEARCRDPREKARSRPRPRSRRGRSAARCRRRASARRRPHARGRGRRRRAGGARPGRTPRASADTRQRG